MIEFDFTQVIETTLHSFDFTFCIIVNIFTYIVIKLLGEWKSKLIESIWYKRLVLLIAIILVSIVYYQTDKNPRLIFNSAILAPVSWSWIFKPLLKRLGFDYKDIDIIK